MSAPNSNNQSSDKRPITFDNSTTVGAKRVHMDSQTTNENFMLPPETEEDLIESSTMMKPPVILNENIEAFIEPILIEISCGEDIVESLINLARFHQAGIVVLSGLGPVTDVTLLHPLTHTPAFPIQGPFNMLSLSGTYINPNCGYIPPRFIINPPCSSFSVFLDGTRRQVFGGVIGGRVMSAGSVVVSVALIKSFEFHRLIQINGQVREFEGDDSTYGGLIPTHFAPNNNAFMASGSGGVGPSQTEMNQQMLSSSFPMDLNVMQWNHSTRTDHNESQPKDS
uniref:AT-hook motif nuclear-localized protein 17-like n=1 Tax=Cicer arietinum TaxID=3827 RepID=A0A1S2XKL0_CICAR|nr:AT-hook motif nuclear-localized protein 17-like [Cicer arietinum]